MTTSYDSVRYPSFPIELSLPSSFAALVHLQGCPYVPFGRSRVLEVGCNTGENLLSLATMAPAAEFVGFDLAASAIADGRALAEAADISNVRLTAGDLTDPEVVEGEFDYIIVHGVYAWVPPSVRAAVLALAARVLSPSGLAFISFNVKPGCFVREAMRTVMLDAVAQSGGEAEAIEAANDALRFFADLWEQDGAPFPLAVRQESMSNLKRPRGAVFHDEMSGDYRPQLFSDFVADVRRSGLEYICDADPTIGAEMALPTAAGNALRGRARNDRIRFEQLSDFETMRRFRQAVIGRPPAAPPSWSDKRLDDLHIRSEIQFGGLSDGTYTFTLANGDMSTTSERVASLLKAVAEAFPGTIPLRPWLGDAGMRGAVARLVLGGGAKLTTEPIEFCRTPGERPVSSPLARAHITRGDGAIATLHHRLVGVPDEGSLALLKLADGSRTMEEIIEAMAARTGASIGATRVAVGQSLKQAGRLGLMMA